MPLTQLDRRLLRRCLSGERQAWYDFVDRFLGVVHHVIHHTAHMRSMVLSREEVEDMAAEVMAQLVNDNFKVLRRFRGRSSVATYLAVIARRVVVNQLACKQKIRRLKASRPVEAVAQEVPPDLQLETQEEVAQLLEGLDGKEAALIRSFYLEQKSYEEISYELGIPINSIGPMLARLRNRLRKAGAS